MARRKDGKPPKKSTSFRLTEEALEIMQHKADQLGIDRTAVIELAVRAYQHPTQEEGVPPEDADGKSSDGEDSEIVLVY